MTNAIDYISINGFKSISSQIIELKPINIIIGANGSGKSNLITVFSFLNEIQKGHLQDYVRKSSGAEQILHFGSKLTKEIRLSVSFSQQKNMYEIILKPSAEDSLYVAGEYSSFWIKSQFSQASKTPINTYKNGQEAGISNPENLKKVNSWVNFWLGSWRLYHVHDTSFSSPLRKTSQLNDNGYLRPDGSNLPSFLYFLQKKHPNSYNLIRGTIKQVAPFFDDFILQPDRLNEDSIRLSWKHTNSDQYFNASSFSDGTLRFITLATLFLQPEVLLPSVILVDEPELGLHPYAINVLASMIKKVSYKSQIILSTQSSLLLDYFNPEDVLIAERNQKEGSSIFTRLDPSSLEVWRNDYSLGQLWEKNTFGGRP